MVERNGERNLVWSRVQGESIELFNGTPANTVEKTINSDSLMQAVLQSRGFDSITQMYLEKNNLRRIPVDILREIVLVDSLDVDAATKTKLVIYRVWAQDGHYSRIKEYFPETSSGLEQIQTTMTGRNKPVRTKSLEEYVNEVMMDEGELGRNYNIIHYRASLINKLLPWTSGLSYIRKFELLAKIINEVTNNNSEDKITRETTEQINSIYEREVMGLENRLRSETRLEKTKSQRERIEREKEDPRLKEVEKLIKIKKSDREIVEITGIKLGTLGVLKRILRVEERMGPRKGYETEIVELRIFLQNLEIVIKASREHISNAELAELLKVPKSRVNEGRYILVLSGRVPRSNLIKANRKRSNTSLNERKIKEGARRYKEKYPGRSILLHELKKISGVNVSTGTVSVLYNAMKDASLPPLRLEDNLIDRIRGILIFESGENQKTPLNFRELQAKYRISRKTFEMVYRDMRGDVVGLISVRDFYKSKREELYSLLRQHLDINEQEPYDINKESKKLGIHPRTAIVWYWKRNATENVPKLSGNNAKTPLYHNR